MKRIVLALLLTLATVALADGPLPHSYCGYYCSYNGVATYCCLR